MSHLYESHTICTLVLNSTPLFTRNSGRILCSCTPAQGRCTAHRIVPCERLAVRKTSYQELTSSIPFSSLMFWFHYYMHIVFNDFRPASLVVGDFGCGDAKIARSVKQKVHSFDLHSINKHVTVCDTKKVGWGRNQNKILGLHSNFFSKVKNLGVHVYRKVHPSHSFEPCILSKVTKQK